MTSTSSTVQHRQRSKLIGGGLDINLSDACMLAFLVQVGWLKDAAVCVRGWEQRMAGSIHLYGEALAASTILASRLAAL
jgi:hypothetical protein